MIEVDSHENPFRPLCINVQQGKQSLDDLTLDNIQPLDIPRPQTSLPTFPCFVDRDYRTVATNGGAVEELELEDDCAHKLDNLVLRAKVLKDPNGVWIAQPDDEVNYGIKADDQMLHRYVAVPLQGVRDFMADVSSRVKLYLNLETEYRPSLSLRISARSRSIALHLGSPKIFVTLETRLTLHSLSDGS